MMVDDVEKTCPLISKPCTKEKCDFWMSSPEWEGCAVVCIAFDLEIIKDYMSCPPLPTIESREIDRFKRIFYKSTIPHYQCDRGRVLRRSDILCYIHSDKDKLNELMNSLQEIELFWEFGILNAKTGRYTQFVSDFDPKDEIASLREQVFGQQDEKENGKENTDQ